MKNGHGDITYKEVVVIGNGPSGLLLSLMMSGRRPYLISAAHPDEMLAARLRPHVGRCLLDLDLTALACGLEGRSGNDTSLLADALLHPGADMGLELEPLIEFRKTEHKIDHIVLGKGPPGGSWHRMDPYILTLSLGLWMRLPGLDFRPRDSGEKRAYAKNVAAYYEKYVEQMELTDNFRNGVTVMKVDTVEENRTKPQCDHWVKRIDNDLCHLIESCIQPGEKPSFISNAINCLMFKHRKKARCKRSRQQVAPDNSPSRKMFNGDQFKKQRSLSEGCDPSFICDNQFYYSASVPSLPNPQDARWLVEAVDVDTGVQERYTSRYVILATGGYDKPNRLEVMNAKPDPEWLMYDLRKLEERLDAYIGDKQVDETDSVLVVGAGLSAADAIIATRGRNIPVVHVFRTNTPDLNKQLPEHLYPEYHKVHQMMLDGGSTYPFYTSYPEYTLTDMDEESRTVSLASIKSGKQVEIRVSFAIILIGARPDLSFLPKDFKLAVRNDSPVDCKTNPLNINRVTHELADHEGLFAVGPLVGDHFVRFLPGGAMAVVRELCRRKRYG